MEHQCYCSSSTLYAHQNTQTFKLNNQVYKASRKLQQKVNINPQYLQKLQQSNQLWLPKSIQKVEMDELLTNPIWFIKQYLSKNIPVIIQGSLDGNDICQRWSSSKYLSEVMDKQKLSISLTPDGFADSIKGQYFVEPYQTVDYIDKFFNKEIYSNSIGYIQHQNNNLQQQLTSLNMQVPRQNIQIISQCFFDKKPPEAQNFWLGRRQSVSSLHKDPYQNFYTTIVGQKHFTLIPPTGILRLQQFEYTHASWQYQQNQFSIKISEGNNKVNWIACNPDLPSDSQLFPNLKNLTKYHVILQSDQMLYLPSLWYHQVSQEHPKDQYALAINYWFDMSFNTNYSLYELCRSIKELK